MGLSLPQALITEKNKNDTGSAWLVFVKMTLLDATILRFCLNTEDIFYDGHWYTGTFFKLTPIESSTEGVLPTTILSVDNAGRVMQGYARDQDGCEGATVLITYVNSRLLAEDYTELEMDYEVVEADADERFVNFKLGAPNPINRKFPLWEYTDIICSNVFKKTRCGYVGVGAICLKTLAACLAYDNTARFRAFLGLQAGGTSFV